MWGFSIPMVQCSSQHLLFSFPKKYVSWPILVKLRILKHHQVWERKQCMCFFLCWLDCNSGIYRRIMGKTFKILFSETWKRRDPQLIDLCLGSFMLFLSCFCYAFVRVCLLMPCGHLLGNGWPLGSRLWWLTFPLWSWVRCGAWLYRFLIFAILLTLWSPT